MSLYYAVGFVREFVHVCETGFAIYLEKWETQSMLIASPLAPRSTCCAAAIWWCSAEICSLRGRQQQRAGWRLQLCARRARRQATALASASPLPNQEGILNRGREKPLSR